MKLIKITFMLFMLILFLSLSQVMAFDFATGKAAYDNKDYYKAVSIWKPLAEFGNADAQFQLGMLHRFGHGVE